MEQMVNGVFNDALDVSNVIQTLRNEGVPPQQISVIALNSCGLDTDQNKESKQSGSDAETGNENVATAGALTGGVLGGIIGLLAGLGAFAIPGLGGILAAGPIVAALGGAALGAATGGLMGALMDAGISQENAKIYSKHIEHGDVLVMIKCEPEMAGAIRSTLIRNNAHEVRD